MVHLLRCPCWSNESDHLGTGGVIARPYSPAGAGRRYADFLCGRRLASKSHCLLLTASSVVYSGGSAVTLPVTSNGDAHLTEASRGCSDSINPARCFRRQPRSPGTASTGSRTARPASPIHHKARLTCKAELCHHCIRLGVSRYGRTIVVTPCRRFPNGPAAARIIHKAVTAKSEAVADDEQILILRDGGSVSRSSGWALIFCALSASVA